jgi:hypothetical protein
MQCSKRWSGANYGVLATFEGIGSKRLNASGRSFGRPGAGKPLPFRQQPVRNFVLFRD